MAKEPKTMLPVARWSAANVKYQILWAALRLLCNRGSLFRDLQVREYGVAHLSLAGCGKPKVNRMLGQSTRIITYNSTLHTTRKKAATNLPNNNDVETDEYAAPPANRSAGSG